MAQIQRARWAAGLPRLVSDPLLQSEAELRAVKHLLADLQNAARDRKASPRQLVRQVSQSDAAAYLDPEAGSVGIGIVRCRSKMAVVLLIGKADSRP